MKEQAKELMRQVGVFQIRHTGSIHQATPVASSKRAVFAGKGSSHKAMGSGTLKDKRAPVGSAVGGDSMRPVGDAEFEEF
jgi:hypothetical protein